MGRKEQATIVPSKYTADGTTLSLTAKEFSIAALGVDTAELAAGAVTLDKIENKIMKQVTSLTLGADATSVNITNLDLDATGVFYLDIVTKHNSAGDDSIRLQFNGDTTETNYYNISSEVVSAAATAYSLTNSSQIAWVTANQAVYLKIGIGKIAGNNPVTHVCVNENDGAGLRYFQTTHVHVDTTNITSLQLINDDVDGIKAGTKIILYEVL